METTEEREARDVWTFRMAAEALEAELTKGADNHAEYLRLNFGSPAIEGLKAHQEDPSLPGSSPEGRAPSSEVIHWGTPVSAVEGWLDTFYHRMPLINPNLRTIGIGARSDAKTSPVVRRTRNEGGDGGFAEPVFYPRDGATEVKLTFGGEPPNPIPAGAEQPVGYPLTFEAGGKLTGAQATVDGASLSEVVGTIAGDDTVFIAVPDKRDQRAAIKAIWDLFATQA